MKPSDQDLHYFQTKNLGSAGLELNNSNLHNSPQNYGKNKYDLSKTRPQGAWLNAGNRETLMIL